ncbi:MAG: MSCRAMM family protein [Candidatus Thorarchaeota archaeon]
MKRVFALLFVLLVFVSTGTPLLHNGTAIIESVPIETSHLIAATDLVVVNETINSGQSFNDDDFLFYVYNYTYQIANATVTLYNASHAYYTSKSTEGGSGSAVFYNLPQGTYFWNVTLEHAIGDFDPNMFETGTMVSDGPDAFLTFEIGNLDWENDDDDFNATVIDISGNPGDGLNFSIHHRDNNSIWSQMVLGSDGLAEFLDIPSGNFTWKITVVSGAYANYTIDAGNFKTNGTAIYVHQTIGPFAGDADFYDLEVFTYYETSMAGFQGALVNVTYYNGTVIANQTTPANGTVQFLDLPIDFINWTITQSGETIGPGGYHKNLTTSSTDIRDPIITSPGNQTFLFEAENITITWVVEDEYPDEIHMKVNGVVEEYFDWINTTEYTYNFTGYEIGVYDLVLVVIDQNNNIAEDQINLTIREVDMPVVVGPESAEYTFTETGNTIQWNITDEYLNMYTVYRGSAEVESGDINPDEPFVVISIDGLSIGTYEYMLSANDTSGNIATHNVTVHVNRDDVAPVIVYAPDDMIYARGDGGLVRNWTITDDFKSRFTIVVDGFVRVDEDWTSETIDYDFAGFDEGIHWVVLTVYDLGGNSVSSAVMVTVTPATTVVYLAITGLIVGAIIVFVFVIWHFRYR